MKEIIKVAKEYKGTRKYSARHRKLVRIFNTVKPFGYTAHISDPWCAIGISAWAIIAYGENAAKKYFPLSAGVPSMVALAGKMGIWKESDKLTPKKGWWCCYDWQDSGYGDNHGSPDHVGLVTSVDPDNGRFFVLECNKGIESICGYREMAVNGKYIRGFIKPNYKAVEKPVDIVDKKEGKENEF